MLSISPLVEELVKALRVLPGMGPKSAQRCALYLLQQQREGGLRLAQVLERAMQRVAYCRRCRIFSDTDLCTICADTSRDSGQLCVVASPMDVLALEQSGGYQGLYFVLAGSMSPLAGRGPQEVGIPDFKTRIQDRSLQELVLATPSDLEGEATAFYLAEMAKQRGLKITRLARGIPVGGGLDHVDERTLAQALQHRRSWSESGD